MTHGLLIYKLYCSLLHYIKHVEQHAPLQLESEPQNEDLCTTNCYATLYSAHYTAAINYLQYLLLWSLIRPN